MTFGHKLEVKKMAIKRVKAKSAHAASHKAPKGKVVTDVNLIDKTRNRPMKTYSLALKNRKVKAHPVKHHKHKKVHRHKK
jgi:hypothetical protein